MIMTHQASPLSSGYTALWYSSTTFADNTFFDSSATQSVRGSLLGSCTDSAYSSAGMRISNVEECDEFEGAHDTGRSGYARAMQIERGVVGGLETIAIAEASPHDAKVTAAEGSAPSPHRVSSSTSLLTPLLQRQLQLHLQSSSSSGWVGPTSAAVECEKNLVLQGLLLRSMQHLNGIPCFLLQAYRVCNQSIRHPTVVWQEVGAAIAAKHEDAAVQTLFDELMVRAAVRTYICMHYHKV